MKLQRMCAVCRRTMNKVELLRVAKKDGIVQIDFEGRLPGRGAYLCKSTECIGKARKVRALERSLSSKIDSGIYDMLEGLMKSGE